MTPIPALTPLLHAGLASNSGEDYGGLLVLGGIVVVWFVVWLRHQVQAARQYKLLRPLVDNLDRDRKQWEGVVATQKRTLEAEKQSWQHQVAAQKISLESERQGFLNEVNETSKAIHTLAAQKAKGFPWLAKAYADYFALQDQKDANTLRRKKRPAQRAAERLREIAAKRREAEYLLRVNRYQLEFYETLFPWLTEFREMDDEDLLAVDSSTQQTAGDKEADPARHFLSQAEYDKLSQTEKNQLALDRYLKSKKTRWQIGRDYERYVGYLFEAAGWDVTYHGIVKGIEDLGRDLLVQRDGCMMVVQCKCWSKQKTIHEKHVFQLFGTTIEYWFRQMGPNLPEGPVLFQDAFARNSVKPVLFTSTTLSETAMAFARILGVDVHEKVPLTRYPCIKCNYTKEHGKIYHLPFDQQYDRTKIQDPQTERFVETVAQAEELGYRRAFRWRGEPATTS